MTQNELREKLEHLHNTVGMPYTLVAKECGLSGGYISLWVKGLKNLSDEAFEKVESFYNKIRKEVAKHND